MERRTALATGASVSVVGALLVAVAPTSEFRREIRSPKSISSSASPSRSTAFTTSGTEPRAATLWSPPSSMTDDSGRWSVPS